MNRLIPFTPLESDSALQLLLKKINATHEPIFVDVATEPLGQLRDCYRVVDQKVLSSGGKRILGWQLWQTKNMIEAESHAVWETPDGDLLDIAPKEFPVNEILFVEDDHVTYDNKQIDNIRLNITKNALVDDLISVSKAIFQFLNKGNRANSYELTLSSNQMNQYEKLTSLKATIDAMLQVGATRETTCLCNSGKTFRNCHGKELKKKY